MQEQCLLKYFTEWIGLEGTSKNPPGFGRDTFPSRLLRVPSTWRFSTTNVRENTLHLELASSANLKHKRRDVEFCAALLEDLSGHVYNWCVSLTVHPHLSSHGLCATAHVLLGFLECFRTWISS